MFIFYFLKKDIACLLAEYCSLGGSHDEYCELMITEGIIIAMIFELMRSCDWTMLCPRFIRFPTIALLFICLAHFTGNSSKHVF